MIAIGTFALFMAKPGVGPIYLWFWLAVLYVGYSMVVLSQTAWGAVLSSDYQQRSRIYGWWQGANVVGMILVLCLPPIVTGVFKGDHLDSVRAMGWFIVILAPLTVLLAVTTVGEPSAAPRRGKTGLKQYAKLLTRPSVQRLLVADLLMGLAPGIAGTLFLFFFERMKDFDKTQAGLLLLIYFVAALVGAPEHRLRKLINGTLGHRNFADYVNGRRIEAAKVALADPEQALKPVSTIAYELGFASLGPFNRAFRSVVGVTPTAWRQEATPPVTRLRLVETGQAAPKAAKQT